MSPAAKECAFDFPQQFAPTIYETFGNEANLHMLELVIIDRRLPTYHTVAASICEYIRHQLPSGLDAVIVALLSSPKYVFLPTMRFTLAPFPLLHTLS
ncbi:hypothetical protein Ciccas_002566 [Cichlidogyrus casuarinus]|uniref:Uncharacterized protein n=1 Tax=Cichlidogyrus casuarinus TaxID=1844966 RepID=A0ABD2QGW3_9PLAT